MGNDQISAAYARTMPATYASVSKPAKLNNTKPVEDIFPITIIEEPTTMVYKTQDKNPNYDIVTGTTYAAEGYENTDAALTAINDFKKLEQNNPFAESANERLALAEEDDLFADRT